MGIGQDPTPYSRQSIRPGAGGDFLGLEYGRGVDLGSVAVTFGGVVYGECVVSRTE